ncbi:MAG: glycosyltransferase family 4 protein [Thermoguttaceae bacterium]
MRIWLINSAEATPLDEGAIRLRRTPLLAKALRNRGHEIVWWNADFFHYSKKHRFGEDKTVEIEPGYTIRFIHGPGYTKHVSFERFRDHRIVAQKFLQQAENEPKPDVILCSLPTLDLADAATKFGKKHGIPVVLDVRDLWPDVIAESVPKIVQPIAWLMLTPYTRKAHRACRNASVFTGNTPKFVEWGLKHAKRAATEHDKFFPFGYEEPKLTQEEIIKLDEFWREKGVIGNSQIPVVTYIGMIGQNFQDDIIAAACKQVTVNRDVRFVFCGGGDRLDELRKLYSDNPHIILPGLVNAKQLWRLMSLTSIALASYKESENYRSSLTNKTIEYMAGGLPILFSIDDGYVADLIRDNEIGMTYGGSTKRLAECVLKLLQDEPYRKQLAENARNLFLKQYQSDTVYTEMAMYLERIFATK